MGLTDSAIDTDFCKDLIRGHITLLLEHFSGKRSVGQLRKHLAWYTKGYPDGSSFRREINSLNSSEEIVELAQGFLGLNQRTKDRGQRSDRAINKEE